MESYGHHQNRTLARTKVFAVPGLVHINLASMIIGNGITRLLVLMASVLNAVCDAEFPVFGGPDRVQCQALRTKVPTCERLVQSCYSFNSTFTCVHALL